MRIQFVMFVIFTLPPGPVGALDWPQFRGPQGDGRAQAKNLPTTWGGFLEPPAWQTPVPGTGWSSPIVIGDRIWVTADEQTALTAGALTEKLAGNPYGHPEEFQAHAAVQLLAVELDARSGKLLRRIDLLQVENPSPIHITNSYASPTPVSDGERLYCHFGSLGTVAVDIATGKILWQRRFAVDDITGPACSPVLCEHLLILVCDGCDEQYVVALDKLSGELIWRQARPRLEAVEGKHRRAFSTPLVVDHAGRKMIIAPTAQWVVSYNPADGAERWKAKLAEGHALIPRPVYSEGLVYVCSGYPKAELAAVRVDGAGDVTETHIAWTCDSQVPLISSPLVSGRELYFVSTLGVASCLDAQTGTRLWQERLPGNYSASPLWADGKLYFTSNEGITTVLRPGPRYQELARNRLFGETKASMAVAGESLLIRTASALYCIRKTPYDGLGRPTN